MQKSAFPWRIFMSVKGSTPKWIIWVISSDFSVIFIKCPQHLDILFGWVLILSILVGRIDPKMDNMGHFQASIIQSY